MSLPKPDRFDISLTEALSLIAWGEHFSHEDFAAVERIPEMRSQLQEACERRKNFEDRLAALQSDALIPLDDILQTPVSTSPDGNTTLLLVPDELIRDHLPNDDSSERFVTAESYQAQGIESWNDLVQELSLEMDAILSTKRRVEVASGGWSYDSDEFQREITSAAEHFRNACKAGALQPRGKPGGYWEAPQVIPIDWWFEGDGAPIFLLAENAIERANQHGQQGSTAKWVEVRVIATEAKALRDRLIGQAEIAAARSIVRTGAPGRPTTQDLYIAEFERRAAQGLLPKTLSKICEDLMGWFEHTYGNANPPLRKLTKKSLEGILRSRFNAYWAKPEK